jgi:hypothetical protein
LNSGWQYIGSWQNPGGTAPPTVGPISPINGTGANANFSMTFNGVASPLIYTYVLITDTAGAKACEFYYDRATSNIYLRSDAGVYNTSANLPASANSSSATLTNSQCTLAVGQSSASTSSFAVTLHLALSFQPAWAGSLGMYLFSANTAGFNSGWQYIGSWQNP